MKVTKILIALLVISFSFASCGKKKTQDTNTKKETQKVVVKKEVNTDGITAEQVKKLSDIFNYGDTLVEERKGFQKEISKLSKDFKSIKSPLFLKKGTKFKNVKVNYFADSVWTTIYADDKKKESEKLFWIIVNYKHSMTDRSRKSYKEKFAGHNAKVSKGSWAWVLLKGDIEIKITTSSNSVKNNKAMEEVLKEFDIKAIESIFNEKSPFPELKEYLLKIKAIQAKITAINKKFKEKELEATEAFKPFINHKGFLKDIELSKTYYTTSNSFSFYLKKERKTLGIVYVGRHSLIGALSYFRNKNINKFKLEGFDAISMKENLVIVKLPKVSVKVSSYSKLDFTKIENLKKVASSMFLQSLAKVK